jgi:hypothetical protein
MPDPVLLRDPVDLGHLQIAGFPIERVQQDSVVSVQLHVVRNRYLELAERDRFAERLKSGVAGSKEC